MVVARKLLTPPAVAAAAVPPTSVIAAPSPAAMAGAARPPATQWAIWSRADSLRATYFRHSFIASLTLSLIRELHMSSHLMILTSG